MTVCGKLYLWILIKSFYCRGNTRDKTEKSSNKSKAYSRLKLRCKEAQDQPMQCQVWEMNGSLSSAGEVPLLRLCQKPDSTVKTVADISGQTQHPCQFCSVSFSAGWKKVGRFWTKSNLLHSHFGPLTETFKLKRENGSHSKNQKFKSFTTPGDLFEWQ